MPEPIINRPFPEPPPAPYPPMFPPVSSYTPCPNCPVPRPPVWVDPSLTVPWAAADAKVVGDRLNGTVSKEEYEQKSEEIDSSLSALSEKTDTLETDLNSIKNIIPENASEDNKLATMADVPGGEDLKPRVENLESDVANIDSLIPESASTENRLATISDRGRIKYCIERC